MLITGIEVIPNNPGLPVDVAPGEKLELTYGDTLRIATGLKYRGPARKVTLYGAIGNRGFLGFDEILNGEATLQLPDSQANFSPVTASVDIPITTDISPDKTYSIYCKIKEFFSEAGQPEVNDVIDIVGTPPSFKLLEEHIYSYAYVYDGEYEDSVFTFTTIPFTPADWQAGPLKTRVEDEIKKTGGRIMEMRVYVDEHLLRPWTNWRIETKCLAPKTTGVGMPVGIAWLPIIILAVLAITGIVVLTWSIKTIAKTFTHRALSEEIKATWSRETLIGCIGDFEEKLERSPTPVAELETKSDQELRDYCDELANAVAPPGEGMGLGILIIGAGIVGIGGLAVVGYALSQRGAAKKTPSPK